MRYQLTRWWNYEKSTTVAFTVTGEDGELSGITFARVREKALELYEIGMRDDFPQRRSLYASLCFVGPLEYAESRGLQSVELGIGHPLPKRIRGARQEPLWHLY
jgi:hypothetical protein